MAETKTKKKTAAKSAVKKGAAAKKTTKKAASKPVAKAAAKPAAKKPASKKTAAKAAAKPAAKKTAAKKAATKKPVAKKPAAKPAPKSTAPRKKSKAAFQKEVTAILTSEKKHILNEVAHKAKAESDEDKFEIGDIYDIASIERERELSLILGDRDREKLGEIEDALDRLSSGEYEECEECGEPISQQRLLAMPFTRVCVDCKSRNEREQNVMGRFNEDSQGMGIIDRSGADDDF